MRWHFALPNILAWVKVVQAPSNHGVGWNANCSTQSFSRLCPILHNFPESIPVGHANSIYRLPTSLDNLDPIEHFALISGLFPCSFFDRTTILPMASGGIIDCQSLFSPPIIGSGLAKMPLSLHLCILERSCFSWALSFFPSLLFRTTLQGHLWRIAHCLDYKRADICGAVLHNGEATGNNRKWQFYKSVTDVIIRRWKWQQ